MKTLILILLFIFAYSIADASSKIFGNSQDYKNSELIFYRYTDRITFIKEEVFRLDIDENGDFETNIELQGVVYVFSEFEIYHAYFFLEPNSSYELILPPYEKKEDKDIFNPFFTPTKVQIGIKGMEKTDLNYLIMDFDYYYDKYHDLNYIELYGDGLNTDVDTFINEINERYEYANNDYFTNYKRYRIAMLKNIVTQKKYEPTISYVYFSKDSVLYDNPAYMDLFNNIYDNYFDHYLRSQNGGLLYAVIHYGHSISRLNTLLSQKAEHKESQFRELVMLKGINDAFGNQNMQWLPLLLTLDSLNIVTKYPLHQKISQNIADHVLSMAKGTAAPPFELPDTAGNLKSLADYRGKYTYIHFANTTTYSSLIEFELIKNIYDKYKGYCIFVTILTDEDQDQAKEFIKQNAYEWDFLFTEINSKTISTYQIDAYPTYFLLNPYGTLIMSPAPSPIDNFEAYLFHIIEGVKEN